MNLPLTPSTRILLGLGAGLAAGIALSSAAPPWLPGLVAVAEPVGNLWLDALRMTVVPLVFALLVTGIASTAERALAGRLALRALWVFLALMFASGVFGMLVVGGFLQLWPIPAEAAEAMRAGIAGGDASAVPPPASLAVWLKAILPANPIKAAADGDMLPLVMFALIFGFAVAKVERAQGRRLSDFFQAVVDALLVVVEWVILLGPIGVFALALVLGARAGVSAAGALGHYVLIVVLVQVLLIALIYPMVALATRRPMREFARAVAPAQAVATSTQSSLASLPAMVEACQALRLRAPVTALVLPMAVSLFRFTGPVANIAVVLYSAALFGVELGPGALLAGALIAPLMSLAAVGLPGQVSFFTSIAPICVVMGVPVGALPLLLAVETIPDIFRTIGNVTADVGVTAALDPVGDDAMPVLAADASTAAGAPRA
jgi:proton glutamate symport protein